jgi:hypothetical protein
VHQYIEVEPHCIGGMVWQGKQSIEIARTFSGKEFNLLNLPFYLVHRIDKKLVSGLLVIIQQGIAKVMEVCDFWGCNGKKKVPLVISDSVTVENLVSLFKKEILTDCKGGYLYGKEAQIFCKGRDIFN